MTRKILILSCTAIQDNEYVENAFKILWDKECDIALWSVHEVPETLASSGVLILGPLNRRKVAPIHLQQQSFELSDEKTQVVPVKLSPNLLKKIYKGTRKVIKQLRIFRYLKGIVRRTRLWRRLVKDLGEASFQIDGVLAADRQSVYLAWRVAKKYKSPLALSSLNNLGTYFESAFDGTTKSHH